ncbi:MAG: ABC transporter ATP-binding protein [Planctomycetes bacterium]|nr:ABC transporter ATP-binding protein [Planctomycetota bacterium]
MTPAAEADPSDQSQSLRALLRRLWAGVCRYKGMVVAMVVFGFLEAAFTKLPFVLVKPLMAELAGEPAAPAPLPGGNDPGVAEQLATDFNVWFRGFAEQLAHTLGYTFDHPGMNVVVACGIVAVLCGLLGAVTIYFVQTISRLFAIRIVADLRAELARHFLALPVRFYGRRRMGELISKVTNDTQVMQRSFELASDNVVVDPLMIVFNIAILAWFVPQALLVLVVMVPAMVIPLYRQGRRVSKRSSKSLQAMGETTESLNQILTGIRTVKSFQLEAAMLRDFEATTRTFLDRVFHMLRAKGRSMAQTFVGYQVGFGILLVLLGYVVLVDKQVRFDDVTLVIMPLSTTYQHVKRLTRSYHVLMESAGALRGIEAILHEPVDEAATGGRPIATVRGEIELRDVHFAYGDEPVLRGLSLHIPAGRTVALVGESGSGKTTTVDLIQRFHDPQQGSILVDGVDLRELRLADYRAHTAVVSQQSFLFNTTIRANIEFGKPGATMTEIEAAARAANIHDFIASLPQGYDTVVGERGGNLSGGQQQRLAIARAIVRDPAILFLDEATSALDSENERAVQKALDAVRRGRTSIVIAHRLSTIVGADLIVVLEKGRVVEVGTHEQLFAGNGVYRRMFDAYSTGSVA